MKTFADTDNYPNVQFNNRGEQFRFLVVLILLCMGNLLYGVSTKYYVDASKTDDTGNGLTWGTAKKYLQSAINLSVSGDQIWVKAGTYKPTTGSDRSISFNMKSGVAIYGGFNGSETLLSERDFVTNITILSGDIDPSGNNDSYHVIYNYGINNSAILDGFIVRDGKADTYGGGIYNEESSPVITNCIFKYNTAIYYGGGMYSEYSDYYPCNPTISYCTFDSNTAGDEGGGIGNGYESNPTISYCTFLNNHAEKGGGMSNSNSSLPVISNCIFTSNTAYYYGGGMYNGDATSAISISNCTFNSNTVTNDPAYTFIGGGGICNSYNSQTNISNCDFNNNTTSGKGGGLYNDNGSNSFISNCTFSDNHAIEGGGINNSYLINPVISGCTFNHNEATGKGGGMYNYQNNANISNCTFLSNISDIDGGGIYNYYGIIPNIINCTFSSNTATGQGGGIFNYYCDPNVSGCTFTLNTGTTCGGIYNDYSSFPSIRNCILWANNGEIINGDVNSSPVVSYSIVQGGYSSGTNIINSNPLFVNSSDPDGDDNIHRTADDGISIEDLSPAIDAGDPAIITPATDITGFTRTGIFDIGAYEYHGPACPIYETEQDGTFNDPATWGGVCIPPNPIPDGVTVIIKNVVTNSGELINNGVITINPPGSFENLGIYGGNGTFNGNFINHGTVKPGNN